MVQKLSNAGLNAQGEYRVENTGQEPLAVESVVMVRNVKQGTDEELSPAERDFIVMPPQATIEPGAFQLFRVRYLGSEPLSETTSYRIIFKQLPLKHETESSGVDLLFNFSTLVFVSPDGAVGRVETRIENERIVMKNLGNGLVDFNSSTVLIRTASSTKSLPWNEFGVNSPANFLVPGQEITIPIDLAGLLVK
ncbi:P pilus assembly protein chaperone PapD [Vibrio maritimus]|uniref:P pilus assembly protein chaperone PapD n=1 Tax=Vibrio maritimus TaxID=990268 RepID=A0A090RV44_9VIBR|nr:P pilus assembly protein chaperone PapD [Vibrio maritimus]